LIAWQQAINIKNMKNTYLLLLGVLLLPLTVVAQQEPMQTQFMYNKIAWNPGYAGDFESPTLTVVDRHQWVGVEGAPNLQNINFVLPILNNNMGLGFNLRRHAIGIQRTMTFETNYAYRIALPRGGYLGAGIIFGLRHLRQDWTDPRIITTQPIEIDNAIPGGIVSDLNINFGTGLYLRMPRWYAGVAVPRLIRNNIDLAEVPGTAISNEVYHLNGMFGMDFQLSEGVKLTPQVLLKYALNAPVDFDVNATFEFQKRFHAGMTYRTGGDRYGESFDVLAGVQATRNLFLVLSYDIGLTRLQPINTGTFEFTARWWFNPPEGSEDVDPNRPN
jgi:type IX secretion system PorP/SprF family membrane protein